MPLTWVDVREIAIALDEVYPDVDPTYLNFVDLRDWVLALPEFDDAANHSGEKVLEAIRGITHIDADRGETRLALGIRDSSIDLEVKIKAKKSSQKISLKFP